MSNPSSIASIDLLRRLEPVVRPGAASASTNALGLFETRSFDELLAGASAGQIRSDRPVQVAPSIEPPLDAEQLQRLALAADRAEASGARQVLMMTDGRGLVMDVAGRSIVSELKPHDIGGILRVDAAMVVPAGAEAANLNGSPFAGLNALSPARVLSAAENTAMIASPHTQAHELIAPKPRTAR